MEVVAQKSILLVEKDVLLRELLRMHLGMNGYTVYEAGNGFEAIKQVRNHAFDLIILELDLPVMDGMEFLHLLRGMIKSNVAVMVLTMVDLLAVRDELLKLGVNDIVAKPIGGAELLDKVDVLALLREEERNNATDGGDGDAS